MWRERKINGVIITSRQKIFEVTEVTLELFVKSASQFSMKFDCVAHDSSYFPMEFLRTDIYSLKQSLGYLCSFKPLRILVLHIIFQANLLFKDNRLLINICELFSAVSLINMYICKCVFAYC